MMTPDQPLLTAASAYDLRALLDYSRHLIECDSDTVIFNNVLLSLMGKLGLGRAAVALPADDGTFAVAIVKGSGADLAGLTFAWDHHRRHGLYTLEGAGLSDADAAAFARARVEHVMPIASLDGIVAILVLGAPMVRTIPDAEARSYALLVCAITAMALVACRARGVLHDTNRRLERRVHRLRSLFEAVREFNALLDRGAILRLLGYTLMGEMTISRFAVALNEGSGYAMVVNHRFAQTFPTEVLTIVAGWGMRVFNQREGLNEREATLYDMGVRATIPMETQGALRGLLLVGARLRYDIDDEDLEYLSSLANLAIGALESARMLDEMIVKERLEEDLRIAAEIQQALLPRTLPAIDGFEIAGQTIPTQQVGGDCYDTIELADGRVLLTIADVSGKGTPASLLMASVQAAVRALSQLSLPLDELVSRINDVIYQNTAPDKFITAFFCLLDPASNVLAYVNAGHNPPLLFKSDGVVSLDQGGVILGIMPSLIPYDVGVVRFAPGDLLVMYTDGVSEAFNARLDEYGEARLRALFEQRAVGSASEALQRLRDDLCVFVGEAPQSDDITIVALRRCPAEGA